MTPQFFSISDIGNSLSDCSQSMKKICIVEVFRANVLKPAKLAQYRQCTVKSGVRDLTARNTITDDWGSTMGKNLYFHFYFYFLLNFLRGSVGVVRIGGPWTGPWSGPWTPSAGLVHGPGVSVFGSPRKNLSKHRDIVPNYIGSNKDAIFHTYAKQKPFKNMVFINKKFLKSIRYRINSILMQNLAWCLK